jgi:hypothetical protein
MGFLISNVQLLLFLLLLLLQKQQQQLPIRTARGASVPDKEGPSQ